ncbi:MAG: hypothetical protein AUJ52_11740 [Elusimicrobia bacterium CG1_02_63_36]|nr:MAG: hypothetical protein AUJ52_11740 [Elusimicrobia bacterium CG1_02_63_36]PIP82526.1 MAG: hypothetical protein COR54_14400 [Elusimicrobia bacterium CG22_combo_CG10-13_8_21_14_all_63_91]PJA15236.1 MAG: hypothetical protein COX66_10775 [Elusimicrobia bacterium CG_4_10_14_0_2_um_filter_63_34]PJB26504.1 MAG: hypothetical protein CO113_03020 [Elusimicrobia bacterium CG_4_9_14_3_um_filter_62_55]
MTRPKETRVPPKPPAVSDATWVKLYDTFTHFAELKPWQDFDDDSLFAVQDPVTGQMGYACILGALGQVLSLCLYRGTGGFDVHQRMQRGEIDQDTDDIFALQDALMAETTARKELQAADLAVIRDLGLKFRGRRGWPLFRSHLPGHLPWHLTEQEAVFLAFALRCAGDAVEGVRAGRIHLDAQPERVYAYFPAAGNPGFTARWEPYPVHRPEPPAPLSLPTDKLNALAAFEADAPWEVQAFFIPAPIMDRERPYFARYLLLAHAPSGYILNALAVSPEHPVHQTIAEAVVQAIEKNGRKPSELHVHEDPLVAALSPLGKALGLRVKAKRFLPAIQEAKDGLIEAMAKGLR